MKLEKRYITDQIQADLAKKMVFVGGARQVGKTTLAKQILADQTQGYLNWDIAAHREAILRKQYPPCDIWAFDELHKFTSWRNYLKELYDTFQGQKQILITGSARLDYYRFGGDSLQGRFHYLRLHPLSAAELKLTTSAELLELLRLGGFPEPYFSASEIEAKRWSREYRQRLIQEDIVTLERVRDIGNIELLMLRLPECVGSPLSLNSLSQDLQVSHKTVRNWLDIFSRLYAIVEIAPFGAPTIRAVKKEQKHYHYDWTLVKDDALRFENCVAMHLLKWVHYCQDTQGRDIHLRYFRDTDAREVDFIIVEDNQVTHAIEVKWNDADISKSLKYFKKKFPQSNAWQISAIGIKDYISKENIRVCPAITLLADLV